MKYLIDTDWVIDYLVGVERARDLFDTLLPDGITISIITHTEIFEGIYSSADPSSAKKAFQDLLRRISVLGITHRVSKENAKLRGELRRLKRPIPNRAFDLLIAATAITYKLILVTRNLRDYEDIPGLELYQ
ncbi:MAG: type II toxin-antitoxin system VapC family toxin [Chloroflexi bacterium]|nr:type II toxin-antitoxin system VapC family toxin [Chloroflexota bacterium]